MLLCKKEPVCRKEVSWDLKCSAWHACSYRYTVAVTQFTCNGSTIGFVSEKDSIPDSKKLKIPWWVAHRSHEDNNKQQTNNDNNINTATHNNQTIASTPSWVDPCNTNIYDEIQSESDPAMVSCCIDRSSVDEQHLCFTTIGLSRSPDGFFHRGWVDDIFHQCRSKY